MARVSTSAGRSLAALLALSLLVATPVPAAAEGPDCAKILADGTAAPLLRNACTLARLGGLRAGSDAPTAEPPWPLYALAALALGIAAALAIIAAIELAGRWARPRRPPDEGWWACDGCLSFNEPTLGACYRCGVARGDARREPPPG